MLWLKTSGFASTTISSAPGFFWKSGTSTSMVVFGLACRMQVMVRAKWSAPPSARSSRSTEVTTTCASPSFATDCATFSGSNGSSAPGLPVLTLQARVQVSPRIIMVA